LSRLGANSRLFQRCSPESHSISHYCSHIIVIDSRQVLPCHWRWNRSSKSHQRNGYSPSSSTQQRHHCIHSIHCCVFYMDLDVDVPLDDIIASVQSIMALDLDPLCPKFWHHAMKDPAHKSCWIEAMFKHLDSRQLLCNRHFWSSKDSTVQRHSFASCHWPKNGHQCGQTDQCS
jgi:hypothetical protein